MRFTPTIIPQLYVVDLERRSDERGYFARAWCQQELAENGLVGNCVQANVSYNVRRGTLRGMHFQLPPFCEDKFVRVIRGAVQDVVLDLRHGSPSFGRWFSIELNADEQRAVFIPQGCAHGYLTLTDDAEVFYLVSAPYQQHLSRGVHWNANALSGAWPLAPEVVSTQDEQWPKQLTPMLGNWSFAATRRAG
jgi:dTDP-4-dehydrorhamnose 3,5-epimerase